MLCEKYRPKTWAEVVGQDKVLAKINLLRTRGLAGRGYWISGASGTGKTTIARLLAADVTDDWLIMEIDAHALTPTALDRIEAESHTRPLAGRGWCYIVNEAHRMNKAALGRLLTLFDRLPEHCTWIFTTTVEGQESFEDKEDAEALLSRCIRLDLSRQGLAKPFAKLVQGIAIAEHLDGKSEERYIRLLQDKHNNVRAALQSVESGEMLD